MKLAQILALKDITADAIVAKTRVHGLPIHIEVKKHQQCILKDDAGNVVYKRLMLHDYGYIAKTKGRDGDEVDVFVGPIGDRATEVYVVHMKDTGPDKKEREDEDKCMVGFPSADAAKAAFIAHYEPEFFGGMTVLPVAAFKKRLAQTQIPHTHNMLHAEELVQEHKRLVQVLRKGSQKEQQDEASRQQKELNEMEK
jgi:hypothetical protein